MQKLCFKMTLFRMANNLPCSKLNLYKTTDTNSQEGCRACHILLRQIGGRCYKLPLNHPGWPTSPCRPSEVCLQTATQPRTQCVRCHDQKPMHTCAAFTGMPGLSFFLYTNVLWQRPKTGYPCLPTSPYPVGSRARPQKPPGLGPKVSRPRDKLSPRALHTRT